jgi:hypothetical protein
MTFKIVLPAYLQQCSTGAAHMAHSNGCNCNQGLTDMLLMKRPSWYNTAGPPNKLHQILYMITYCIDCTVQLQQAQPLKRRLAGCAINGSV